MATQWDFKDKTVLVTGVGRAGQIGHAVAEAFGRAGARVVAVDRNAVGVAERVREFAAQGIEARPAAGDLTEPDVAALAVEIALKHYGRLDAVVNVAGGLTTYGPVGKTGVDGFDREIAINLKTAYLMSRAAVEALTASRGAIVNFASVAYFRPAEQMAAYTAAKAGVAGLTQSLAAELWPKGVRVNAIAPGMVRTPENVAVAGEQAHYVEMSQLIGAVLFLAGESSAGISGHILPVTNGAL
ncbi:MAG: SDR family oxidoreductase [Gemmatimonadetes bacterium]|jgi:NAD(P)-dependent dehydrogenase (short-subunit alcohol dehydrogenase family)|nr:SDR family oxidoreductase [Gemmatimonadota bacterium]MBP6668144.1 SDR family oxidoreductase [Gemmatimonadales bacterium]MBK6779572.1 SDR family oxidoreductase [Gemmatimonadota bacterium]MBK7350294.1 SDR family oxidoreductase [Gemmatimonadota bacterium]MBK7716187.1 SDR family oxidoreductase [Gemmatimonadota bacterium]